MKLDAPTERVIFITGATGLVGGELARRYMDLGVRVYALVRSPSQATAEARLVERVGSLAPSLQAVPGDLTAPRLGLDDTTWQRLASEITDVLHAATDIHFDRALNEAWAINVAGTQRVVELAENAPRLRQFGHISTVYVAGKRTGRILETELTHTAGWLNTYEETKHEAECWLQDRMADLPIAIYRLSSVLGDSRTGEVRQFNFAHQLLRLVWNGLLPALPGEASEPIDMIASDWVGAALTALFDTRFTPGATFHLCTGPEQSCTLAQVLALTMDRLARLTPPGRRLPQPPELISLNDFYTLIEATEQSGQRRLAQVLGALALYTPHLAYPKAFDNSLTLQRLNGTGVVLPSIADYYPRIIDYCVRSHWGRNDVQSN